MTTSGRPIAHRRARSRINAAALGVALWFFTPAVAAAPQGTDVASGSVPVVFFWSSPSRADVEARPHLLAAVQAAAAPTRSRVLDLSPLAPSPPDTGARVERAVAAYDAMRFADAISELDQAAAAAAESGAWGLSRDALVDLFLYRGLCKTESDDQVGAWNDFVRAATLDPARVLDPARFRPSAVKSFGRAVRQASARAPVLLTVEAPAGSRIFIDGRSTGRERLGEPLLPGEHYVLVERPAAPPFSRVVTLAAPITLVVPDEAVRIPDDGELRGRAARLGAGAPLVVALSRQGGLAIVELRSLERQGGVLRGAVRLGPSPAADARDLRQAVAASLRELSATPVGGPSPARADGGGGRRWYHNRWLWFALGAAGALAVASPFLLDSDDSQHPVGVVSTDGLER